MDDYDYCDSFSGSNSFRARSNTWPLNRPDFITPASASACIDDTLPEIDLEDDDLFTTADNWTTADLVDHDPMSWDPILNGPPSMLDNSSTSMSNSNHNNQTSSSNNIINNNNNHNNITLNVNSTATEHTTHQPGSHHHQIQPALQTLSLNPTQQLHLDQHSYHQQQHHHLLNGVKQESPSTCIQHQHNNNNNIQTNSQQQFSPNNNNNNNINNNNNNIINDSATINGQLTSIEDHTLTPANIVKLEQQQYKNHNGQSRLLQQQQQLQHHQIIPSVNGKVKLNTPRRNAWGNMSYADLISQAINSTDDKRLTLSQIYDWMVQNVPYFKDKGDSNSSAGWKNSVRHNLSLHNRFKRIQNEGTGKSSWWIINPEAIIGKCARRRAASMEASRYEKKRGRAKKRVEAIRNGIISYPSLTDSSITDSFSTEQLNMPGEAISSDNLHTQTSAMLHISQQPPTHQSDSYYQQLTQHHQLLQQQQPTTSIDHLDLVGHTVYMTEPCNDCNCPEIMNCTNALSLL